MTIDRTRKHESAAGHSNHGNAAAHAPGRAALTEGDESGREHGHRAAGSLFSGAVPWQPAEREPDLDLDEDEEEEATEAEHQAEHAHEPDEPHHAHELAELHDQADETAHEAALPVDASSHAPLPHRDQVEQMFGTKLDGVKAHTGANLSSLGAQAAAHGDTVAFEDKNPDKAIVAHEVAHVLQQRRGGGGGKGIAPANSGAEHEAERVEAQVAAGGTPKLSVDAAPAGGIHLKRKAPYAPTDKFNKKQTEGRPMVKVGGKTTFKLKTDAARYSIVSGQKVRDFDTLSSGAHITVNVSQPRVLQLPDGPRKCVLSRTTLGGSAWIGIEHIEASGAKLAAAAHHAANKSAPAAPRGKLKPRVFRADTKSNDYSLTSNHARQTRAQYDHYLHRESNKEVEDGFYNVCMALPQHGKVPTAIDVARPGDHFFVMQTREAAVYKNGGSDKPIMKKWAFGCLGKQDGTGKWHPDKSRRGWVPLEALT